MGVLPAYKRMHGEAVASITTMVALDFVAVLDAKAGAYEALCALRDKLRALVPPEHHDACVERIALEAMRSPCGAGVPALDAAVLMVLREITVLLECLAEELSGHRAGP
jgi:hypothetical protein